MAKRLAAAMSLVAFAICLIVGIRVENSFSTSIANALIAMFGTLLVGLVLGWMAQKMLDENLMQARQKKLEKPEAKTAADDR